MANQNGRVVRRNTDSEAEMSRHQCDLVDVCFEEGQYDAGIKVLDQLRSSTHKPSASHIRQLLYIALYPPTYKGREQPLFDPSASPSKFNQVEKSALVMPAATVESAQRLLIAFARTNTPDAVLRAVPRYTTSAESTYTFNSGFEDSVIAKESSCISAAKNVWQLLAEGFIERTIKAPRKAKAKSRRSERFSVSQEDTSSSPSSPVGQNVWPVLDWLLMVFERDEILTAQKENLKYSPLLLSQLPQPRGGETSRWEVDPPLDVIFHCRQQRSEKEKLMGSRLLTLLINLSSTIFLDYTLFLTSVFGRVADMPSKDLGSLMSSLTTSAAVLRFRVSLFQRFLSNIAVNTGTGTRPRPQARAQPKPVRSGETAKKEEPASQPESNSSKHQIPSAADILRLVERETSSGSRPTHPLYLKYEILVAYGNYQKQYGHDTAWRELLSTGQLEQTVDRVFSMVDGDAFIYKQTLIALIASW